MPIQPMTFNPLSFDQTASGLKGAEMGQQIAQNNLSSIYAPQVQAQQLQKQQLANALSQLQLKNAQQYLGQQTQAGLQNTQAQTGLFGAQAGAQGAQALQTNVGTTTNLLGTLRQMQITRQVLAGQGVDTSAIDNSINQINGLLSQAGNKAGFGSAIGNSMMGQGAQQSPMSPPQAPMQGGSPVNASQLPLSPQQAQILQAMNLRGGQPGTIGGNLTGQSSQQSPGPSSSQGQSLQAQPSDVANALQVKQAQAASQAKGNAYLGSLSGNPEFAKTTLDIYNNEFKGNPIQEKLATNDAAQMKSAIDASAAASQMQPLLKEYQQILAQTPQSDFLPVIRGFAGMLSPNFRTLENISNQLTQYSKDFTGMPAKAFSNQELNLIKSSWADPKQTYGSLQNSVQTMNGMVNRVLTNRQMMQDYLNKNGTLNGYKPYTGGADLTGTNSQMVTIEGTDGKQFKIPSQNLSAALKRGAKKVG